jgi:hypothetical protein
MELLLTWKENIWTGRKGTPSTESLRSLNGGGGAISIAIAALHRLIAED